ncbi:hypothetical protein HU200_023760 [Digitaria exilis]|uniref:NAC domain-containing protein n=1 Tax=Digitaria exilis TaxID=1010633 RepID=A0A835C4E2_9POAL|nr:hypothetical protein HU200_023760 [Digitaria exilis]CAB3499673.1 unnamed protein product [Digitaria exilis]
MASKHGCLTKHGFPRGYRFVPTPLELISLLTDHIHGDRLPPPLDAIFHHLTILDYHPSELYERFKGDAEHRYIYFFSWRQFQKPGATGGGGGVAVPEDKDQKEPRPVRVARGGGWKPSGGGQVLRWPRRMGGFVAGRMVTMVFYDRTGDGGLAKSNWGMHEFIVPVDSRLTSLPSSKYTRFYDLALYRLYILKSGDMENESSSSSQMMPFGPFSPSTLMSPCPPIRPCGIFPGKQPPLAAGASTSQMPPPPPPPQQLPSTGLYYHHHHHQQQQQHAFGATAAGAAAAQHQVRTMPLLAAGFPGNSCHFASPPPVAADPAAHQPPASATQGAGQEAFHSGATRSPPAIGSPKAEQDATAATEPAHAHLADCVKPEEEEEEAPPPSLEDVAPPAAKGEGVANPDDGLGMLDWSNIDLADLTPLDDNSFLWCTMDEITSVFDESPATEGDQDPPAALSCC